MNEFDDEQLIARAREVAPSLFASLSDRDRLAAGLLYELADRLEGQVIQRDALNAYARQNADVHRENLQLRDRIAGLEAAQATEDNHG